MIWKIIMSGNLDSYIKEVASLRGEQRVKSAELIELNNSIKMLKRQNRNLEQALIIVQTVAQQTQQELSIHINDIVSSSLAAVFEDDPYSFDIEFVLRRNKTEADCWFVRGESKRNPLASSGVGAVDIACFALRVGLKSLESPNKRGLLILDEPFKHLRGKDENIKAIQIVKELSDKLNIQVIMVTDEKVPLEEIEKGADKVFNVGIRKRVSKIN